MGRGVTREAAVHGGPWDLRTLRDRERTTKFREIEWFGMEFPNPIRSKWSKSGDLPINY